MVVRVKVLLRSEGGRSIECSAILNSGYESDVPEVALPRPAAKELGLRWEKGLVERYGTAGPVVKVRRMLKALKVYLVTEDREVGPVTADAIILGSDEVLLSDKLIDELGVVLERAGEGLWRFRSEEPVRVRRSVEAQKW